MNAESNRAETCSNFTCSSAGKPCLAYPFRPLCASVSTITIALPASLDHSATPPRESVGSDLPTDKAATGASATGRRRLGGVELFRWNRHHPSPEWWQFRGATYEGLASHDPLEQCLLTPMLAQSTVFKQLPATLRKTIARMACMPCFPSPRVHQFLRF